MLDFGVRFGALVRQKRAVEGLTQEQLAFKAFGPGGRKAQISDLERGKIANPQAKIVDALVVALEISDDDLRACREPVELPSGEDRPDLPPLLLENLAMRFGIASPDAPAAELEAYLREAAKDYKDMKARLDALAEADGRIANLVGAAKGALDQGDFDEADARLADAEEIQQTEHTLVQVRKQAELRTERGKAALMNFDVETAYGHFCEAAAFFEPFDKVQSGQQLYEKGITVYYHAERFAGDGLQRAIDLWIRCERVWSREANPEKWGRAQNALGNGLRLLGTRSHGQEGIDALARAVTAYRAALEVRAREAMPADWAMIQNNLGAALQNQGIRAEGEAGLALLADAVAAYRAALEVYTQETMAVLWAATQNNLGNALANQGGRAEGEAGLKLLAEAVTAYRAALEVYTRDAMPVDWAMTQNNLGNALANQGIRAEGEASLKLLAEAVIAYRAALEVRTQNAMPVAWAESNECLCWAFQAMAERDKETAESHLDSALSHIDLALEVYDPEHMSYRFNIATGLREKIVESLAALGDG